MSLLTLGAVAIARDLTGHGDVLAKDATVSKTRLVGVGDHQTVEPLTTTEPAAPTTAAVASFGQLLVAQIPSEALIAYTTLLALFSASGGSYTTALWAVYGAAIVVCAVAVLAGYLAQRDYTFDDTGAAQGTTTNTRGAATGPATQTTGVAGPAQVTPPVPVAVSPSPAPARSPVGKLHLPFLPAITAMLSMAVYGLTVPGSPLQSVSGTAFGLWSGCLAVGGGVLMSVLAPLLGKGNAANAIPRPR